MRQASAFAGLLVVVFACTAPAQPGAVHVSRETVDAGLAKGGVLIDAPIVLLT